MARLRAWVMAGLMALVAAVQGQDVFRADVFTSGSNGYKSYRIPAIVRTGEGTLLAFAEGRRDGPGDSGKIDTVLRRSQDNGSTWGPQQVVWSDGENTCGNPAPVVDAATGRIVLLGTWNRGDEHEDGISTGTARDTRRVFVSFSDDDGASWAPHREITDQVKKPEWGWYATGPCHGIQMGSGRLVIPCNQTPKGKSHKASRSHVIFSDDGGDTWTLGGSADAATNEATVAELSTSGSLVLNMRSYAGKNRRAQCVSDDAGVTLGPTRLVPELIEPVCQGSLLRVKGVAGAGAAFVFSNPASKKRENLTLRLSTDDCQTWSQGYLLQPGFSAYSDLVELSDGEIGCLYEAAPTGGKYERITFARLPVSLLAK